MNETRLSGNADGIQDPHDILAAEDFAMPAGPDRLVHAIKQGTARSPLVLAGAAALAIAAVAALRRR